MSCLPGKAHTNSKMLRIHFIHEDNLAALSSPVQNNLFERIQEGKYEFRDGVWGSDLSRCQRSDLTAAGARCHSTAECCPGAEASLGARSESSIFLEDFLISAIMR